MEIRQMIGWLVALLAVATVARAQEDPAAVYTGPAGIPGTPTAPAVPGDFGQVRTFNESAYELTITPVDADVTSGTYIAASTIPGDVIMLADPAGGDAPSNWAAVVEFFDPGDPTGAQGSLATEEEGFLLRDSGANGFAGFSLLPNVYYAPATFSAPQIASLTYQEFGPAGVVPGGHTDITTLTVEPVPEPGAVVPLALGAALLGAGALSRRQRRRTCL